MSVNEKLTDSEYNIIAEHLNRMITACDTAIMRLRQVPKPMRPVGFDKQLAYHSNARSGLNWALRIAEQRKLSYVQRGRATV